ncbi:MAG TPA: SPOR domain-containing protein [Albitalea sp.]|nr:SPOR domain-containing protein [Albitalea sp.]
MGLLSIFKSKTKSGAAPKAPPADVSADSVQQARIRARRRLIGAVVLVIIGVIGFPLLFETQPRPIPVDIPIEVPRKDAVPPLAMPAARPKAPAAVVPVEPAASEVVTETRAEVGREVAPAAAKPASTAPEPVVAKAAVAPPPKPAVKAPAAPPPEPKPAAKDSARYVVQVGAFADTAAARETRSKVEKLGLKTYTQSVETAAGNRIRVRVGPFASRDEAERAMAKAKAAGVAAVVLTL